MALNRKIVTSLALCAHLLCAQATNLSTVMQAVQQNGLSADLAQKTLREATAEANIAKSLLYPKVGIIAQAISSDTDPDSKALQAGSVQLTTSLHTEDLSLAAAFPVINISSWHTILAANQLEEAARVNTVLQNQKQEKKTIDLYLANVLTTELYHLALFHYRIVQSSYRSIQSKTNTPPQKKSRLSFINSIFFAAKAKRLKAHGIEQSTRQALVLETQTPIHNISLFKRLHRLHLMTLKPLSSYLHLAQRNNIHIHLAQINVQAYKHQYDAAKARVYPTLSAKVAYSIENENSRYELSPTFIGPINLIAKSPNHNTYVAVTASAPLYTGGAISNQISRALAQLQKAQDVLRITRRVVNFQTKTDYLKIKNFRKQIMANYYSIATHKEALARFAIPLPKTLTGLMLAFIEEQTLLLSCANYDTALVNYFISYAHLQADINQLNHHTVELINRNLTQRSPHQRQYY